MSFSEFVGILEVGAGLSFHLEGERFDRTLVKNLLFLVYFCVQQ